MVRIVGDKSFHKKVVRGVKGKETEGLRCRKGETSIAARQKARSRDGEETKQLANNNTMLYYVSMRHIGTY